MSTFEERMHAFTTVRHLPEVDVELATWRRLVAMRERMIAEDPSLAEEPGRGMEHVVYAAVREGLRSNEAEHGVVYDENTGKRALAQVEQTVLDVLRRRCAGGKSVRRESVRLGALSLPAVAVYDALRALVDAGLVVKTSRGGYRIKEDA